jgi:phospholipid/cholesterol/gamma-HCH transport system permease protein
VDTRIRIGAEQPIENMQATGPTWQVARRQQEAILTLSGNWLVHESGLRSSGELRAVTDAIGGCARVRFLTGDLGRWDSALVAFIWSLQGCMLPGGHALELDLAGLPEALRRLLALTRAEHEQHDVEHPEAHGGILEQTGAWVLRGWGGLTGMIELLGATVLSIPPALRGTAGTRFSDVMAEMYNGGIRAIGIIAVVNSLVGAILAFVGAVQLQRFGAGGYIADLVGIAVVREMAPIMTAIVMAGRTGGAYAAQIAMMQGNEEIDALQVASISPVDYLVLPRMTALITMMPFLYAYACFVGIAGGFVVAFAVLSLSPTAFLVQLQTAVPPAEFYIGFTKSVCFGAFIALSSCQTGLRAGRSATDVGDAATGAVVTGIVGVIALDAVFAVCANVIGI